VPCSVATPAPVCRETTGHLDDDVAIVSVDGKDVYFDAGSPFCPFRHLAWKHTMAGGLRQTEGGSELVQTPGEPYKASSVKRIADLHMDEHGSVKGIVKITYEVAPTLTLRQTSLRGDNASLGVNSAKPSSIFFLMASKSK
jgi:hypothetical protein